MSEQKRSIKIIATAKNAAGVSEELELYSTITRNANGEFSISSSPIDEPRSGTSTSSTSSPSAPSSPTAPPPSGGGIDYFTPEPEPIIPPAEQNPDTNNDPPFVAPPGEAPIFFMFNVTPPEGTETVVVPYRFATPALVPYDGMPSQLATGSIGSPVDAFRVLPVINGQVKIPANNLANNLNRWGLARASYFTEDPPVNTSEDQSAPVAFYYGARVLEAAQTAFQVWFFDSDGDAIGLPDEHGQDVNREMNSILIEGTGFNKEALETLAIQYDNSYQETMFPCRPNSLTELRPLDYSCHEDVDYPPAETWLNAEHDAGYPWANTVFYTPDAPNPGASYPIGGAEMSQIISAPEGKIIKWAKFYYYPGVEDLFSGASMSHYLKVEKDGPIKGFECDPRDLPKGFPDEEDSWPARGFWVPTFGPNRASSIGTITELGGDTRNYRLIASGPIRIVYLLGLDGDDSEDEWVDTIYGTNTSGSPTTILNTFSYLYLKNGSTKETFFPYAWNYLESVDPWVVQEFNEDLSGVQLTELNPQGSWNPIIAWVWSNIVNQ